MSYTHLLKAEKPVWAKQLTRLPCLVVYTKFKLTYTTGSTIGSELLLASTCPNVLPGRGHEKALNGCLGVSNVSLSATWSNLGYWTSFTQQLDTLHPHPPT